MTAESLTPERAVRLLRAKAGELENISRQQLDLYHSGVPATGADRDCAYLRADLALFATLLADHIERVEVV